MMIDATRACARCFWRYLLRPAFTGVRIVAASRWGEGGRPFWQALGLTVLLTALALGISRHSLVDYGPARPSYDRHAQLSLEIAVNRILWGLPSHYYVGSVWTPPLGGQLKQPDCGSRTVLSLSAAAGEPAAIALQHLVPIRNNENSLMLMDTWLLRALPHLTVAGLTQAHNWLEVACLAVFLFFLVRAGTGLLLSLLLFEGALTLVRWVSVLHPLSLYPFLLPCTLLLVGCLGLVLKFGLHRRPLASGAALLSIGALVAFVGNLRTTYLLVALALTLAAGVISFLDLWRLPNLSRRGWAVATLLPVCAFGAGFWAFDCTFLAPIRKAVAAAPWNNRSYHLVMHPLVLSLAVPESALSRREGIAWNDERGLTLARRMDPQVTYLGDGYERALLLYYLKLWLYDSADMARIYAAKLGIAGAHYFVQAPNLPLHGNRLFALALNGPRRLGHGGWWLGLFGLTAGISLVSWRRLGTTAAFGLTALGTAGLLLLLEAAAIMPYFVVTYHSTLLFTIFCMGLLPYQLPLDGAFALSARLMSRYSPPSADASVGLIPPNASDSKPCPSTVL